MKCVVLAGGRGEKLWPLSRKNLPKQFIEIQKDHSIFQETIARNLAFCDEFVIIANYEYRYIIENQMAAFQGVPYQCIYEEIPKKTAPAILLTCLSLQPSELVFVVSADNLIETNTWSIRKKLNYQDSILKAKEYAKDGKIVLFGLETQELSSRFGYYAGIDDIEIFYEKPDEAKKNELRKYNTVYQNLGMMIFQNGYFLNELNKYDPDLYAQCVKAHKNRKIINYNSLYSKDLQNELNAVSIEKCLIEKSHILKGIQTGFRWADIGQLEDLELIDFKTDGIEVDYKCNNTIVYNQSTNQAVVVNGVDNAIVLNTQDAIYVGKRGESYRLKDILHNNKQLNYYSDQGVVFYRQWGTYITISEEKDYRIRKVVIQSGKTIYEHVHEKRRENWTIVKGKALISLNGNSKIYEDTDNIDIPAGVLHQISNVGDTPLILIETAIGEVLHGNVFYSEKTDSITERDLGIRIEPFVRLQPVFKDYLWGGTRILDKYNKSSDLETVAESWELSGHPAGNSIIASGKHKGLSFSKYLENVGKEVLGWKCGSMQNFPILIKLIDARDNLSVQVHPDDEYALNNENEYGKNEMWYVIDSEPGSGLYVGFKQKTDKEEIKKAIEENNIIGLLNFYPTSPGDVFFIPSGTVHAIGKGNLICEIQQSSNSTYRLYDYNRKDKFGNVRELHLDKALDVLNYERYIPEDFQIDFKNDDKIITCKYFETIIMTVKDEKKISLSSDSFCSLVCIEGDGEAELSDSKLAFKAGDSLFIPATDDILNIKGNSKLILTKI